MLSQTARSTPHGKPDRVTSDRAAAYAILDEALVCHVGIVENGEPVVIPTNFWRIGDTLYFHGGRGSRLALALASGVPVSVTVTLVDGMVLSRSAFHHSMNYRSVMLFGRAAEITDPQVKAEAFAALVDKLEPGRSAVVRATTEKELAVTRLLALPIDEGTVKSRSGPPKEDEGDLSRPVWAGVVPLETRRGTPVPDAWVTENTLPPRGEG